jgi:ABC-type spermidine/putrescine transport system permease subunit II
METLKEWLLGLDTLILVILIFGGFVAWELKSGEIPLRWFGSIRRGVRPFIYWISILFHLVILGIVVYSWVIGLRIPVSRLFE